MRVLIVDDCEMSAGMLAVVLEIYGHQVQQTRSLGAALRVAGQFRPEMVLLTVSVPVGSTEINAADRLREASDVEPLIFAICTTPDEFNSRERASFDRVFSRPVRFGQLKPYLDAPVRIPRTINLPVPSSAYAHSD